MEIDGEFSRTLKVLEKGGFSTWLWKGFGVCMGKF